MANATIVAKANPLDPATVERLHNVAHAADVKEAERRAEVRRRFKRIQKLNAEQERMARGWEPGFHNRIKGARALVK